MKRALFHGAEPSAIVSDSFVKHFGKGVGDMVDSPRRPAPPASGSWPRSSTTGRPKASSTSRVTSTRGSGRTPCVTAFSLRVLPGSDPFAVKKAIEARLGPGRGLIVAATSEMRRQLSEVLDESFAFTHAIEIAALAVGLLGLFTTALASTLKRARGIGMLRAIGMSAAQLRGLLLAETMLLGLAGGAAAVTLGSYISWCFVVGSLTRVLGWIIVVRIPWSSVLVTVAAGLAIGAVAGLLVAGRVSRVPIREALGHE